MDLVSAFEPDGVVTVVGAGGKKSTLYALGAALDRAIITASVRIPLFDGHVEELLVTETPVEAMAGNDRWPLGLVPGEDGDRARYLGYEPEIVDAIGAATDVPVLVKGDGARTRLLKAPAENEPKIPASSSTVVPVASVQAVGKPLTEEFVHRPERVTAVTGRTAGETIQPSDVVSVLRDSDGGLRDVPEDARVVALLNMVDDEALAETARDIATEVIEDPQIDRVVLSRMDLRTIVDVVE
ncbi:MAG: selenium cofactor biosynthesis protein YqeC [Natronomonas sp.]